MYPVKAVIKYFVWVNEIQKSELAKSRRNNLGLGQNESLIDVELRPH